MNDATRLLCGVCSDPVEPDIAHSLHEDDCAKSHHLMADPHAACHCDLVAHPDCCPAPQCQDIGTGLTVVVTARFAVPPWFSKEQVRQLGESIVEHLTQPDYGLQDYYGPEPEWEDEDSAYICAAFADLRAIQESVLEPSAVIWGHGEHCKRCHHLDHDLEDGGACVAEDCDCTSHVPYVPAAVLRRGRS